MLPSCPFSNCVTPGISRRTHPEGEPCIYSDTLIQHTNMSMLEHCPKVASRNTIVPPTPLTMKLCQPPTDTMRCEASARSSLARALRMTEDQLSARIERYPGWRRNIQSWFRWRRHWTFFLLGCFPVLHSSWKSCPLSRATRSPARKQEKMQRRPGTGLFTVVQPPITIIKQMV